LPELKDKLIDEINYLNEIALQMTKVYQYWHHRRLIVQKYGKLPPNEYTTLDNIYSEDDKNYHMWTYRMWLTQFSNSWEREFIDIVKKLGENPKNNSAWSYRYFLVFHDADYIKVAKNEVDFARNYITKDVDNESAWVYYKGLLFFSPNKTFGDKSTANSLSNLLKEDAKNFCMAICKADEKNRFSRGMLVDLFKENKETVENAKKLCDELCEVDKIRKNYWLWVKENIDGKKLIEEIKTEKNEPDLTKMKI